MRSEPGPRPKDWLLALSRVLTAPGPRSDLGRAKAKRTSVMFDGPGGGRLARRLSAGRAGAAGAATATMASTGKNNSGRSSRGARRACASGPPSRSS
eukprot:7946795-Pyramimonas_sp.AAC.1